MFHRSLQNHVGMGSPLLVQDDAARAGLPEAELSFFEVSEHSDDEEQAHEQIRNPLLLRTEGENTSQVMQNEIQVTSSLPPRTYSGTSSPPCEVCGDSNSTRKSFPGCNSHVCLPCSTNIVVLFPYCCAVYQANDANRRTAPSVVAAAADSEMIIVNEDP